MLAFVLVHLSLIAFLLFSGQDNSWLLEKKLAQQQQALQLHQDMETAINAIEQQFSRQNSDPATCRYAQHPINYFFEMPASWWQSNSGVCRHERSQSSKVYYVIEQLLEVKPKKFYRINLRGWRGDAQLKLQTTFLLTEENGERKLSRQSWRLG